MRCLILLGLSVLSSSLAASTDKPERPHLRCYACTSYIDQCKYSVEANTVDVFKTRCSTKCYTREGEDGAIYRGCFDGFVGVPGLHHDFVGCRNITWPFTTSYTWCLCDSELCNKEKMVARPINNIPEPQSNFIEQEDRPYLPPVQKITRPFEEFEKSGLEQEAIDDHYEETLHGNKGNVLDNGPQQEYEPEAPPHSPRADPGHFRSFRDRFNFKDVHVPGHQDSRNPEGQHRPLNHIPSVEELLEQAERRDPYSPEEEPEQFTAEEVYQRLPENDPYGENFIKDPYYPLMAEQDDHAEQDSSPPYNSKQVDEEVPDSSYIPKELAKRISCADNGFYRNPDDCRTFVACIHDPSQSRPVMHMMRCPERLVWDNADKICRKFSTTCNVGGHNFFNKNSIIKEVDTPRLIPPPQTPHDRHYKPEKHYEPEKHYNQDDRYEPEHYEPEKHYEPDVHFEPKYEPQEHYEPDKNYQPDHYEPDNHYRPDKPYLPDPHYEPPHYEPDKHHEPDLRYEPVKHFQPELNPHIQHFQPDVPYPPIQHYEPDKHYQPDEHYEPDNQYQPGRLNGKDKSYKPNDLYLPDKQFPPGQQKPHFEPGLHFPPGLPFQPDDHYLPDKHYQPDGNYLPDKHYQPDGHYLPDKHYQPKSHFLADIHDRAYEAKFSAEAYLPKTHDKDFYPKENPPSP